MSQSPSQQPVAFTALLFPWMVHLALAGGLLFRLVFWVPRHHRTFRDFNMRLPTLTEGVLTLSGWLVQWLFVAAILWPLLALADGLILWALGGWSRRGGRIWFLVVGLTILAAWILTEFAILYPMMKLTEALSR
jgi:type II secretory pathway component PulF